MSAIEYGMEKELIRYHEVLSRHEVIIRTALQVYIDHMGKSEKKAQSAYEAGQADQEVKATQDKSWMTNSGYHYAARAFRESANSARKASSDILNATLGLDEDDDSES
ncbi:hypothetical protein [Streptomyces sp. 4F14]|uniref:hypothetical protein n=1 Tax=Streptomyces sp. 4F14 TaxID=3394380 RepID=UPI003A85C388